LRMTRQGCALQKAASYGKIDKICNNHSRHATFRLHGQLRDDYFK